MRKLFPALTQLRFIVSQGAATFVGCVLFAIGFSGVVGVSLSPIDAVSFLNVPTGFGAAFDQKYWAALIVVGIWLVLFVAPRLAAFTAILLIVAKWLILNDLVPTLPT